MTVSGNRTAISPCHQRAPVRRGVLAGPLTPTPLVLPMMIMSTLEALQAVLDSLPPGGARQRTDSLAGAAVSHAACRRCRHHDRLDPGHKAGCRRGRSGIDHYWRLLHVDTPASLRDDFTVMPLQVFTWAREPKSGFDKLTARGMIVFLAMLLAANASAVIIHHLEPNAETAYLTRHETSCPKYCPI